MKKTETFAKELSDRDRSPSFANYGTFANVHLFFYRPCVIM